MQIDSLKPLVELTQAPSAPRDNAPGPGEFASPLGVHAERRTLPRPDRALTATDIAHRMEPVLYAAVLVQALVSYLAGDLRENLTTLTSAVLITALGAWALAESLTRRVPAWLTHAMLMRGIALVAVLPALLELQVFPFWHWLWIGGASLIYSLTMPALRAGAYTLFAALYCSALTTLVDHHQNVEDALMRAAVFLLIGQMARYIGQVIDTQARIYAGMQIGERRAQAIAANTDVMMIVVDRDFNILQFNHAVRQVLGYETTRFRDVWGLNLVHLADQRTFSRERDALLGQAGASSMFIVRARHHAGTWVWLEVRLTNLLHDPAVHGFFASVTDVSARVAAEEKLRHQATYDSLTGLPNRGHFTSRLASAMAAARTADQPLAVFVCDIDHFKAINDQYGHETGDHFLRALAQRLRPLGEVPGRVLARFDSDEFVLLAPIGDASGIHDLAQQLLLTLGDMVRVRSLQLQVEASIGVATLRPDHNGPEALIHDADAAMFQAKESGRNRHAVFDAALRARVLRNAELARGLRGALKRGELTLVFQPKVRLATGQLIGFEVLVRWNSPEFGAVLPGEFIPLAEDSGMIVPIGLWALGEACRWLALWQARFPDQRHITLAVNVSMRQMAHEQFLLEALRLLREAHLEPGTLEMEITETSAMVNPELTVQTLNKFKAAGLRLALDDFGTGYSSLAWLRRLPVDAIKIDQSFVRPSDDGPGDLDIVKLVIALAQTLGIECIAEGIETRCLAQSLHQLGCQTGQGYYFNTPLPAADAEALLARKTSYLV